jgi:cytochrome c peroxidase
MPIGHFLLFKMAMRNIFIAILFSTAFAGCTPHNKKEKALQDVHLFLISGADSLRFHNQLLLKAIEDRRPRDIQTEFLKARKFYKKIEGITEYYFPTVCKAINGPALKELEEEDDKIIDPTGFQVVEEFVFPTVDSTAYHSLLQESRTLNGVIIRLQGLLGSNTLTHSNVFEASRLQVLRIISLGISGFDSPIGQHSIQESYAALEGLEKILAFYLPVLENGNSIKESLSEKFKNCKTFLLNNPDFNSFDRAYFISACVNPLCNDIYFFQQALKIKNNDLPSAIRMGKATFFEERVFDELFFAPIQGQKNNESVTELGKLLFYDPILSGNNQRACASCHNPQFAFSDPVKKSRSFNSKGTVKRNTPTLVNSVFQQSQFWDGRVAFFEDQIQSVLANPLEMHGGLSKASLLLRKSNDYVRLFSEAFNDAEPITENNIQKSLAAYLRSLTGMNSRFDQFMRGDAGILSAEEIKGFNLFMGKAKCGTCHFMPLFNGSVPPFYKETEAEVLGVPVKAVIANSKVDSDHGKFHIIPNPLFDNMFKTPTVRNAALTAPYMHNGVYGTIEEVLDFYNRGGGAGIGIMIENQTLPADKLNLSEEERRSIISFIGALTDTVGLTSVPLHLPTFNDKELDRRKPGGIY